ncbi:hypothetical protein [Calothrix sp. UHCC 0171]|uniref:hypothetical protein n=1 Tax=Calothrix sp. UHCC 0171 TaxID=3110245 RepID=UPI002B21DE0E|nr:hypothetical protein [Calothrix sp. UHCC 0171]MEA5569796.1 hypothetical protein [Calothrix sp. UHCC 0171]
MNLTVQARFWRAVVPVRESLTLLGKTTRADLSAFKNAKLLVASRNNHLRDETP